MSSVYDYLIFMGGNVFFFFFFVKMGGNGTHIDNNVWFLFTLG